VLNFCCLLHIGSADSCTFSGITHIGGAGAERRGGRCHKKQRRRGTGIRLGGCCNWRHPQVQWGCALVAA
jgi:hypothetical protein